MHRLMYVHTDVCVSHRSGRVEEAAQKLDLSPLVEVLKDDVTEQEQVCVCVCVCVYVCTRACFV